MIALLGEYRDVFAWSYDDMKGLDPKFYQHQINLAIDAKQLGRFLGQLRWQSRMIRHLVDFATP